MNSKSEILGRLRKMGVPDHQHNLSHWEDKELFADFPRESDNLIDVFGNQLMKLSGEFYPVKTKEEGVQTLQNLLQNIEPKLCKTHKSP